MDTEAVKQLWPFWIARKPREWVSNNLHGGVVTNGDIAIYLPKGRIEGQGVPVNLDETEMKIAFDIDDTRITLNDQFPDVNRSDARVTINGGRVDVEIEEGTLNLAKGQTIELREGTFAIADSYSKPLTGQVDVILSGDVRDLVELAAAPPINALKGETLSKDDFSGGAEVNVKASFPLDHGSGTMPAEWGVVADITDGRILKPINGYAVADLDGLLEIVPGNIAFEGQGTANGVLLDIQWSNPLGQNKARETELWLSADLDDAGREKLAPGLGSYVSGPISMTVQNEKDANRITLDLRNSVLSLPWLGWEKPKGAPASLAFLVRGGENGVTVLEDLRLMGGELSARGRVTLDKDGLLSTTLTDVALSKGDNVNIGIQREKTGWMLSSPDGIFLPRRCWIT
nr:DUF3971 domain-containing protein [Marinicella sp. W31]MDC2876677.1 DUF3971 domain-containing protein [Marinicella sp. W31]